MTGPKPKDPPASTLEGLTEFRIAYGAALRGAPQENLWYAERFDHLNLELLWEVLAGPLSHLYETGECDYVFADDPRFPGVNSTETFRAWCMESLTWYRSRVSTIQVGTEEDSRDRARLMELGELYEKTIDLACVIIARRFQAGKVLPGAER